jgi:DNA-binding beta-propeller fold protein YncE
LPQNAAAPAAVAVDPSGKFLVVAAFSGSTSQGVTVFSIDSGGALTQKATVAAGNNPAGIAFH